MGCRQFVQSYNLFKALGKARFEQYQTLGMEQLVGRRLSPESTDGRLELKTIIPVTLIKRCPDCQKECLRVNNYNNHMTCPCGSHFCWQDLQKWDHSHESNHLIGF